MSPISSHSLTPISIPESFTLWRYVFFAPILQRPQPQYEGFSSAQSRKSEKKAEPLASGDIRPKRVTSKRTELGDGNLLQRRVRYCGPVRFFNRLITGPTSLHEYPKGPRSNLYAESRLGARMGNLWRGNNKAPPLGNPEVRYILL